VVVLDILGVINEVPVPNEVPPVKAAYQFNEPALAVAPNVTVPVPQTEPGVVPETVGTALTVATTALLVAVEQPLAVASK
jgi:hypothetical protein